MFLKNPELIFLCHRIILCQDRGKLFRKICYDCIVEPLNTFRTSINTKTDVV